MIRLFGRSLLSLLVVLQAVQPALACNCEVMIDDSCGCAMECASCEPVVIESQACDACGATVGSSSCDCEAQTSETSTEPDAATEKPPKPQAAETNKPETFAPPAEEKPTEVTPAPALETPTTVLPAPPINVPSEPATTPSTTEVFPGPAPVESTPARDPAVDTPTDSGGLFDEPASVAAPTDLAPPAATIPAVEDTTQETSVTDDLFVEPSQPASEPDSSEPAPVEEVTETETETIESESTEEPATETDPLDELFGPSTPSTEPEPETKPEAEDTEKAVDPFDPFSQQELPSELRAPGGLASGEFRIWSNRAANFSCDARLVRLTTGGVFLTQPSGEFVAMSFSQLSDADISFVRAQVRAKRTVLARATAATQFAARTAQ